MNARNLVDNRYLLIKEVGIGGFATVYRAWDTTLQKFVAIKKIHEQYSNNAKLADMFRAEALNTAKLEHENIVRVINFIKDQSGNLYIIFEYVNGVTLSYFIEKCRRNNVNIPHDFTLYVISEVVKALDYAHSVKDELSGKPLNIVHRDISPANIMIYYDGRIKLTDFGIAKAGDTHVSVSEKGKLGGKISYMSPEQARGDLDIDIRSDLFSAAIIIYEMLTGQKAFEADSEAETLQRVKTASYDAAKLKKLQISKEIQEIIKKALQKSPDKRYQTTIEMFIEIKKYLSKTATTYELGKKYTNFIRDFLKTEAKAADKEKEDDLKKIFEGPGAAADPKPSAVTGSVKSAPAPQGKKAAETPGQEPSVEDIRSIFRKKIKLEQEINDKIEIDKRTQPRMGPMDFEEKESTPAASPVPPPAADIPLKDAGVLPPGGDTGIREEEKPRPEKKAAAEEKEKVPPVKEPEKEEKTPPPAGPAEKMPEEKPAQREDSAPAAAPEHAEKPAEEEKQETKEEKKAMPEKTPGDVIKEKPAEEPPPAEAQEKIEPEEELTPVEGKVRPVKRKKETASAEEKPPETAEEAPAPEKDDGKAEENHLEELGGGAVSELEEFNISEEEEKLLKEEKTAASADKREEAEKLGLVDEALEGAPPAAAPPVIPRPMKDEPSEPEPSGEKTVFDFVLDTAKKHKKIFISAAIALVLGSAIYSGIDTYFLLTGWGIKIHNMIWPPALQVDTIPSGAQIQLFDRNNTNIIEKGGYQDMTPSFIREIQPGVYTMKLKKDGFREIVRNVTVYSEIDENRDISIARAKKINGIYTIPFEIDLEVDSVPADADFFLDDVKIGKTPVKITVEIGKSSLRLEKEGFETLGEGTIGGEKARGICMLNTMLSADRQQGVDERYWNISQASSEGGGSKLVIKGVLWKNYRIESKPPGAQVFIDDSPQKEGDTPLAKVALTAGKIHAVKLSKDGFEDWLTSVDVELGAEEQVTAVLKKIINLTAYEKGKSRSDIGAYVTIDGTDKSGKTPFEVALPVGEYSFKFTNEPRYKIVSITQNIEEIEKEISVGMELRPPYIKVTVKDFKTGKGVSGAMVWVDGEYWKRTDASGVVSGYVDKKDGEVRVEVKAENYDDYKTSTYLQKAIRRILTAPLGTPNDGVLLVDASEDFGTASINLDGEYIGNNLQWIFNITRARHILEIKSDKLKKAVREEFVSEMPGYFRHLKLLKGNAGPYLSEISYLEEREYEPEELIKGKEMMAKILEAYPEHRTAKEIMKVIDEKLGAMTGRVDVLMSTANRLFEEERYDETIKYYEEVLAINSEHAEAGEKLTEAKRRMGVIQEKEEEIKQRKKEEEFEGRLSRYYDRGTDSSEKGDYEQALEDFEKGVEVARELEDHRAENRFTERIKETKLSLSEQHYQKGYILFRKNEFAGAREEFKQSIAYNPMKEESIAMMKQLKSKEFELEKQDADDLMKKGVENDDIALIEQAIEKYQQVLAVNAEDEEAIQKIKDADRRILEIKERRKDQELRKREERLEGKVSDFYDRGAGYYDDSKYEMALAQFEKGMAVVRTWGNEKWAEKFRKKISDTRSRLSEHHYELGYNFYQKNELEEAQAEFKQSLSYNPVNTEAKEKLEEVNQKMVQVTKKKAERLYNEGIESYAGGDIKQAIYLWEQVLELDPDHKEAQKALERAREKVKSSR
ncbi:MAG: PEGA domain-containing protein [Elusimicrobia bacterium]|nr:PEGA domain-containing protein [Elusimicrobiota bacterium]